MSDIPQVTRIDFTNPERLLLSKVFHVCSTFMLSLVGGGSGDEEDALAVKFVMERPTEMAALLIKVNSDRPFANAERPIVDAMELLEKAHFDATFERIKKTQRYTIEQIHARNPGREPSSLQKDMEWLITELEKRV